MRRLLKWAFGIMILNSVIWAAGQAYTRSKTSQDLSADDIELYTFWNGAEFAPTSQSLRTVTARILMGGATVDLRDALPSPDGLAVDVGTTMGGVAVLVSKDWDVEVVETTKSAQVEVKLDEGTELPSDSPKVTVQLATTYGGALVGYELPAEYEFSAGVT